MASFKPSASSAAQGPGPAAHAFFAALAFWWPCGWKGPVSSAAQAPPSRLLSVDLSNYLLHLSGLRLWVNRCHFYVHPRQEDETPDTHHLSRQEGGLSEKLQEEEAQQDCGAGPCGWLHWANSRCCHFFAM